MYRELARMIALFVEGVFNLGAVFQFLVAETVSHVHSREPMFRQVCGGHAADAHAEPLERIARHQGVHGAEVELRRITGTYIPSYQDFHHFLTIII